MKYEPVFGDQLAFDGMMPDCEFIVGTYGYKIKDGKCFYCEKYNHKYGWSPTGDAAKALSPVIAMRRIIAEPKRWTVEDQKTGRLPEFGALVKPIAAIPSPFLGVDIKDRGLWVFQGENGFVFSCLASRCEPIETPEEKAKRFRKEWCNKALGSCSILSGMQKYELKRLGVYIEDIYDALLSGDLPAPVKGQSHD